MIFPLLVRKHKGKQNGHENINGEGDNSWALNMDCFTSLVYFSPHLFFLLHLCHIYPLGY